ncbi:MAG TPA: DUF427 domain-containing protein [Pseudonocardiaceae bacterium]|nr:DUF427 domain-containing protein [Pseudonocardiaceae bacterium]
MMHAVWNGVVLAEAPRTVQVKDNHYFPPESVHREHFVESSTKTVCPWKGLARYYTVLVDGKANPEAAWTYPKPAPLVRRIRNHVAFCNGVRIEGVPEGEPAGLLDRLPTWLGGRVSDITPHRTLLNDPGAVA